MDKNLPVSPERGEATRRALIEAASAEFAERGFDAVSHREIAARAGANPALIGYHFGSKEGLYLAVFEAIAARIQGQAGGLVARIEATLAEPAGSGDGKPQLELLLALLEAMARMLAMPEMRHAAQLIVREQQAPTKAFDVLWNGFMQRALRAIAALVVRLRPDLSEGEARLTVLALFGQTLVFRVARTAALRYMNWNDIGSPELETIIRHLRRAACAQLGLED